MSTDLAKDMSIECASVMYNNSETYVDRSVTDNNFSFWKVKSMFPFIANFVVANHIKFTKS